jgi:hypothetical protein
VVCELRLRPRTNAHVIVTMTFPDGITSSEFEGVVVRYRGTAGRVSRVDRKALRVCGGLLNAKSDPLGS